MQWPTGTVASVPLDETTEAYVADTTNDIPASSSATACRSQDCTHQRVRARTPYNGLGDCLDCGGLTWVWLGEDEDAFGSPRGADRG